MPRRNRTLELLALGLILALAAILRWYGLDWDAGYLYHPDERQIVLVVSNLELPATIAEFISPSSPLNPSFFAYGSFPLYLLRVLSPLAPPTPIVGPWSDDQLARWLLFGRALSGLFDLGTIVLTYLLGRRVYDGAIGLIGAAAVAFTVLHIQLSHFYAVDTLLTLFVMATLYSAFRLAEGRELAGRAGGANTTGTHYFPRRWLVACGVMFGLSLATKISALPLIVPLVYASYRASGRHLPFQPTLHWAKAVALTVGYPLAWILGVALAVFILTQPYVLLDAPIALRDFGRELAVARGWLDYPYTRQYADTLPLIYQIVQSTIWGMGLPLGLFTWSGLALFIWSWWQRPSWRGTFLLSFALAYLFSIAFQYAKYLRYLLPLLPLLYLIAAYAWLELTSKRRALGLAGVLLVLLTAWIYSVAFVRLYANEHPWLTASRWIYENIAPGSVLLVEEWDDALPSMIEFPEGERRAGEYTQIALPLYDDDTELKRLELARELASADAVVLASQRIYASIGRLPERYPLTNRYYAKLFRGDLGFEPVMTVRNDPNLFGVTIRDDPRAGLAFDASSVDTHFGPRYGSPVWNWGPADESYSVYDHPQPIVFVKVRAQSAAELAAQMRGP
jgi:4-amino-4-deoxy-L-arabinose transferase-like glycosyltransferase